MNKVEYKGVEYKSLTELCRSLGKNYDTVLSRLSRGMSLKQAIEAPIVAHKPSIAFEVKDHLGNVYASRRERAKAYGITYQLVDWRLAHGWSLADALTHSIMPRHKRHCKLLSVDHNGKVFDTPQDMCAFYNIPMRIVTQRLYNGWGLERALTTKCRKNIKELS